jgi:hypothetical protein
MSLFDVTFQTTDGGLGRTLAGNDAISGLVAVVAVPATGSGEKTQVFYSLKEAQAAGVDSALPTYYELSYQIASFFARVAAPLYVTFSGGDFTQDLADLQAAAEGSIRQVGVIGNAEFNITQVVSLQSAVEAQVAAHQGLSVLYAPTFPDTASLSALPTLTTLDSPNVSVVIGRDLMSSYSSLGDALGTVALAKVSECIGWPKKFNSNSGNAFDQLGFTTGENYKAVSIAQLNQTSDKGYVFLRKYTGFTGSFYSDSKTATSSTSDFATIENVRSLEKATRVVRAALVPELGSPLKTKAGKLSQQTITHFQLLVQNPLDAMVDAGELSEFSIFIDPEQKVLATSKLEIQVGLTPLGVARQIVVPIGFQVKATN